MINEVVAFTGIPLTSNLGFVNAIILLLLVSVAIRAIFTVFGFIGRLYE